MTSINKTEKPFNLTDIISYIGNEPPQRLTKFICGFRKCHSFCSNIWEVSIVTTLLIYYAANSEMFRVNTFVTELLVLFHRWENKQAAEEIHSFPSSKLSKHEIVWKPHTTFFNRAKGDSKKMHCHKSVLCTKRGNWYYLKYNCYRPLRRECGIAHINLNSRTDCIMLTMLERKRLTCCFLPQWKAHNVRAWNVSLT